MQFFQFGVFNDAADDKVTSNSSIAFFLSLFILVGIMYYYKSSLHAMFGDVGINPLQIIIRSVSGPN